MCQDPSLSRLVAASPGLLSLADPYTGYTALHWAAKVDIAYIVSHHLNTLLLLSSLSQHDNEALLKRLLQYSCDVNQRSHGGYTPLHLAAINKSQKVASIYHLTPGLLIVTAMFRHSPPS